MLSHSKRVLPRLWLFEAQIPPVALFPVRRSFWYIWWTLTQWSRRTLNWPLVRRCGVRQRGATFYLRLTSEWLTAGCLIDSRVIDWQQSDWLPSSIRISPIISKQFTASQRVHTKSVVHMLSDPGLLHLQAGCQGYLSLGHGGDMTLEYWYMISDLQHGRCLWRSSKLVVHPQTYMWVSGTVESLLSKSHSSAVFLRPNLSMKFPGLTRNSRARHSWSP